MKTLNTIQTLSKISKIISKIIIICSIVGLCCCIVGIISLAFSMESFKLGGVTFESILQDKANLSEGMLYAEMAQGIVYCIGTIILAKFAENYFKRELNEGTPFTFNGAKELMRLGILSICIPIGEQIISSIVYTVLTKVLTNVAPTKFQVVDSVSVGIALIVISLLCRYGAELKSIKTTKEKREAQGNANDTAQ